MINKKSIYFSIPRYIPQLILPKVVMIHGEVISSVYFQLAVHINNQKNSKQWQKNSCWLKTKTISQNTGYNTRLINESLKTLQKLQLIDISKKGKLKIYTLKNNNLKTASEVISFNNKLESLLITTINKNQKDKSISKFEQLNSLLKLNNNFDYLKDIFWLKDVSLIRQYLNESERIYKGSSLFFINFIASNVFSENSENVFLENKSESEIAILIGNSQSTVSRYLQSYIENGILTIEKGNVNIPHLIKINVDFFYNKGKAVIQMSEKSIYCPICKKCFADNRSLSVHIAKTKEPKHTLLNHLKKQAKYHLNDINKLYNKHKEDFDELDNLNDDNIKQASPSYLNIPCKCNMSCEECYKNWKLDFYNDCSHERKSSFIKEFNIIDAVSESKEIVKKEIFKEEIISEKVKEDVSEKIVSEEEVFEEVVIKKPKKVKKQDPDNAPGLVKYFYNLTGGTSPNWAKEASQVKNLLKKNVTPDDIRTTMDYLIMRGNIDLRFINRSVQEALLYEQYKNDLNVEGTEANIVKMYYDGLSLPINYQTLINDVQKIKETLNSGLSYEQTKLVVKYMIDIKCPTLNFIGSKRTEALTKANAINSVKNNPSFFDRDDLVIIKNDLINGRANLRKINVEFKNKAEEMAKDILKSNTFSSKYTPLEWAWKIGLNLDSDLYTIASDLQKTRQLQLDIILNDPKISPQQKEAIIKAKEKFNNWVHQQEENLKLVN